MKIFCGKCSKVFNADIPEGTQETVCPECSETVIVPESPLSPGAVIGDFLLEKSLSSGGMGVVYLARQLSLDRPVALKVLRDKFAANQEYIEGLFHEARAAAKLTHPNIVQAYAVGEENGVFYFAMEYIRGETFKQILKKQNILDTAQAVKVIREICSALQAAWNEQKLVHQDIKPDNIMLDSNGFAKLADLGLARSANTDAGPDENETEVMGTPQYISPEQLTGVPTDVRSDIYSLGATFYQFVTGQFPYPAESAEEMAHKHVEGNLTPPIEINPELPKPINDVIIKMMARNIDQRYQTPSEVIADLDAYQDLKKISSIAVPKLKLNLNKKGTGGPAPAKPGLALKTAAKPGMPSAAKPAVPPAAKPAVPPAAKPAVPPAAKPAVPPAAKPAVPPAAKPAVPPAAKPAVPPAAKPAVPPASPSAEPPAAKPAEALPAEQPAPAAETKQPAAAAEDDIALAPKKEKPEEKPEEKSAEGTDKKNSSDKKKKKSEKESSGRGIGKIILLIVLIPLILLVAASGLFFAAHKGIFGKKGQALSGSVCTFLQNKKIISQPGTKEESSTAKNSTSPAKTAEKTPAVPVEKPKPVTRKEFIAAAEKLISDYRIAPKANAAAFLKGTDRFIKEFLPPRTREEKEAFGNLYRIYDTVDDFVRAQPYRLEAVKKIEAQLKQRELEAEKAREAEKKRQQALNAAQEKFSTQTDIKEDKEKDQRIRALRAAYALLYRKLAEAFVKSVHTLDPSHFTQAARSAESPFSIEKNSTQQEYDMEEEFINFRDVFLKKAFEQFKSFYADVRKITPANSFSMGNRLEIEVIKVEPPKVIYKHSQRKGERELKLHNSRRRAEFYRHMLRKTKNRHIPFFFEFLEGRLLKPVTDKNVPSKEWTRHLKNLCPPIKARWTSTAPKAPVRKAPARPVRRRR